MSARNPNGLPQPLNTKLLEELVETMEAVRKDEVTVYRGHERYPIISFSAPAMGRLTRQAMKKLGECAQHLKLESRYPKALRAAKGSLPGYMIFEPLMTYDQHAPDQYEIKWGKGFKHAYINLLPILQPRNLQVSRGYVAEMPFTLEHLPKDVGWRMVLHMMDAHVRAMKEIPKEEEDDFTNDDEFEEEATKGKAGAAPGKQK